MRTIFYLCCNGLQSKSSWRRSLPTLNSLCWSNLCCRLQVILFLLLSGVDQLHHLQMEGCATWQILRAASKACPAAAHAVHQRMQVLSSLQQWIHHLGQCQNMLVQLWVAQLPGGLWCWWACLFFRESFAFPKGTMTQLYHHQNETNKMIYKKTESQQQRILTHHCHLKETDQLRIVTCHCHLKETDS